MRIVFTGGGTAGHAMVNTVLIPYLQRKECRITYIGSKDGMEKTMISAMDNVSYYGISTGKLRRYFSFGNFTDIFRLGKGVFEAWRILKRERPQLIYASGGYVSVPVVWASYLLKIPVILRETDYSTGLANKLCIPFAKKLYLTFPDSQKEIKNITCLNDGMIIRPQLFDIENASASYLDLKKPLCLVMGGSSGSANINRTIWDNIDILTKQYSVIHICGKGNYNSSIPDTESYQQLEFVQDMSAFYQAADVVITRSGSNAIMEGLLLGKRMVCIPLSTSASRGEQMLNAKFAEKNGTAVIIHDRECNISVLLEALHTVLTLPENHSYETTKEKLLERIRNHVNGIYQAALEQLQYDMKRYLKYGKKINVYDLTMCEMDMLDELASDYDL